MTERQKHTLLILAMIASVLPVFLSIPLPEDASRIPNYLAKIAGYTGIAILVWNTLLGVRPIASLFFSDIATKIALHRFLGTYGIFLILLHPLGLVIDRDLSVTYLFSYNFLLPYEQAVSFGRLALAGLGFVWITSAVLRSSFRYSSWKYAHYLTYPITILALVHVPTIGSYFSRPGIQASWVVWVIIILSCYALKLASILRSKPAFTLTRKELLSTDTYEYTLTPARQSFSSQPGQYAYLQLARFGERHPFSIVKNSNGVLTFAIKTQGTFSAQLAECNEGTTLYCTGPYGSFTEEAPTIHAPVVFIAGGIGITPFMAHLTSEHQNYSLIYANQTEAHAAYRNVLRSVLHKRMQEVYSTQSGTNSAEIVFDSFITPDIIASCADPTQAHYFICGPSAMTKSVIAALQTLRVPKSRIHTEAFTF